MFDPQKGSQVRSKNRKNDHFGGVGQTKIFFFVKNKLIVVFFGVKLAENYYAVGAIP